jgi:hypothetical protein
LKPLSADDVGRHVVYAIIPGSVDAGAANLAANIEATFFTVVYRSRLPITTSTYEGGASVFREKVIGFSFCITEF